MRHAMSDVRQAVRRLRHQPLFSVTVILLVAIGIAGNAAVFRIANGLFLRPLPFAEADRLVDLDETAPGWNLEFVSVSITDFRLWEASNRTFEAMTAFSARGGNLAMGDVSTRVSLLATTHHADEVLRIEPLVGRFYTEEEDAPGVPLVALLAADFWRAEFAGDPAVVGRSVQLGGQSAEIIGVLPDETDFLTDTDLWIPLQEDDASSYYLSAVGRLRAGVGVDEARADLLAVHRSAIDERSENEVTSPTVASLRDRYLDDYRLGTGMLLGAVALVLLIACANIAGLMVARALGRRGEMSMRRALGASRWRLIRQLLIESLVLAGVGSVLGVAVGVWGSGRVIELLAEQFPAWVDFDVDLRFLTFVIVSTVGAAVAFGLVPALQDSGVRATEASSGGRTTASRSHRRLLGGLIVAEVAAAVVLLVVAGLAIRDVRAVGHANPGFDASRLVTYRLQLDAKGYPDTESRRGFALEYQTRLAALPGVVDAMVSTNLPLMGHSGWFFEVEGHERPEGEMGPVVLRRWVSPNYLEGMDLTLVAGRSFTESDGRTEGESVIIVNETFVDSHLPPGSDPLGQRVSTGGSGAPSTIVGVVRDVDHYGPTVPMRPGTYEPLQQSDASLLQVALRTTADPLDVVAGARQATLDLDPGIPLFDVQAMQDRIDESLLGRRASTWLVVVFSGVALSLAVAGLYGVVSYSVGQRAREIGIRMALGAPARTVARQVVRDGMYRVGLGLAAGLVLGRLAAGALAGLLVDVQVNDPWVFGVVGSLLVAVAFPANWWPARRAAATDATRVLRGD